LADFRRIPVRLNLDNPEHLKIMNILDDLNLDVHKSKNKFIINAISFYVDAIRKDNLTNSDERNRKEQERAFVTQDEMQEQFDKFAEKVRAEVYEEMIRFLAGVAFSSGANSNIPVMQTKSSSKEKSSYEEETMPLSTEENVAEALSQYDNVLQQVMSWSEDE